MVTSKGKLTFRGKREFDRTDTEYSTQSNDFDGRVFEASDAISLLEIHKVELVELTTKFKELRNVDDDLEKEPIIFGVSPYPKSITSQEVLQPNISKRLSTYFESLKNEDKMMILKDI